MKRILFVTDDLYPNNSGGKVDVNGQLQLLSDIAKHTDIIIDVLIASLSFSREFYIDYLKDLQINNVYVMRQKKVSYFKKLFSSIPYHSHWVTSLLEFIPQYDYEVVYVQSEYFAIVTENKKLKFKKLIIRVHNDEVRFFVNNMQLEYNVFKKSVSWWNVYRISKIRDRYYSIADLLLFISEAEYNALSKLYINTKSLVLSANYKLITNRHQKNYSYNVIYIGAFTKLNIDGLIWFLQNVHEQVLQVIPQYRLIIGGKKCDENMDVFLNLSQKYCNIDVYFDLTESKIKELYKDSSVAINPMLRGNGVKIKTIEYLNNGLPVVTTSTGADGTMLDNYDGILVGDSAELFQSNLISVLTNKDYCARIVARGIDKINSLYQININILNELFDNE